MGFDITENAENNIQLDVDQKKKIEDDDNYETVEPFRFYRQMIRSSISPKNDISIVRLLESKVKFYQHPHLV